MDLKDNESHVWKLDAGSNKVEMTASDDGAQVRWVVASCGASGQAMDLRAACRLESTEQLIAEKPTEFAMGTSVSVTVKVTRVVA